MSPLEVKNPQWKGEQLEKVRQQQIEDVDQLAASSAWATQVVQSPERQQVAGETQREDDAIDTGKAKRVRVQGEVTAVIRHVSVGQAPDMGH